MIQNYLLRKVNLPSGAGGQRIPVDAGDTAKGKEGPENGRGNRRKPENADSLRWIQIASSNGLITSRMSRRASSNSNKVNDKSKSSAGNYQFAEFSSEIKS